MGVRPNLVDRSQYDKNQSDSKLTEKLKFILSKQDTFDPYEGQKKNKMSNKYNVAQSYIAFNKIERFGGKIANPFEVNIQNKEELGSRVFTSEKNKKQKAIQLIDKSFENVKKIK